MVFNRDLALDVGSIGELDLWNVISDEGEKFLIDLHWAPESGGYLYHNRTRYEITGFDNFSKIVTVNKIGRWA